MWGGHLDRSGASQVRETCHLGIVNSSYTADFCNNLRHIVIATVCDENSNMCERPTTVAVRPYLQRSVAVGGAGAAG